MVRQYPFAKLKIVYVVVAVITIAAGLFVRYKKDWFPEWFNDYAGDALYAFMMYYLVSIAASAKAGTKLIISVLICFAIEISQLYRAEWINAIRQTLPGRLVLGSGFLYSDLAAYMIGGTLAFFVDHFLIRQWLNPREINAK